MFTWQKDWLQFFNLRFRINLIVSLGRRQEVGPEGGSGRLEGEHGVVAFSLWPGRNPGPAAGRR